MKRRRFIGANPGGQAADGGEGFSVGGTGLACPSEADEEIAAALEKYLRALGGSGEPAEAGEGGVGSPELQLEVEGTGDEGGGGADAGEREFDIGEGGGGIVVQGVGLEPKLRLRFAQAGEGGGEIDEGGPGVSGEALRPGREDERGGIAR